MAEEELESTQDVDIYASPTEWSPHYVRFAVANGIATVTLARPPANVLSIEAMDDGPAKFFGLAHTVRDIDATAALLSEHIGNVKDAVQPGRRITTLRHKPLGMSVATAFMSPEPGQ